MSRHRESPEALTDFEELFCIEYTKNLNATDAYIKAGFKGKRTSAAAEASKLLRKPNIVRKIRTLMEKRAKRVEVDSDKILRELKRMGYSDLRGLFKPDGTILPPVEWSTDLARAVASIEVEEIFEGHGENRTWIGYTKKVKFWPKDRALELMGKHKRLFTDKVEHEHKHTLADLVAGSNDEGEKE